MSLNEALLDNEESGQDTALIDSNNGAPNTRDDPEFGEDQPRRLRDVLFSIAFYAHLIIVLCAAVGYGLPAAGDYGDSGDSDDKDVDYEGLLYFAMTAAAVALVTSAVIISFLAYFAKIIVKFGLYFSVIAMSIVTITAASMAEWIVFPIALVVFFIMLFYIRSMWRRIPFASANLGVATKAIRSNVGGLMIAYFLGFITFSWVVIWILALIGLYDETSDCKILEGDCDNRPNMFYLFLLFVSFFWTYSVINGVVAVTYARIVGTWWSRPGVVSTSCCSKTIKDALSRAAIWSFGSICFGALITAIIRALRTLLRFAQRQSESVDCGCCLCCFQCMLSCLDGVFRFINRYALVYVGLYGYNFRTAGSKVWDLFQARGWDGVIGDSLIESTLFFISLAVGGFSGLVGLTLERAHENWFEAFGSESEITAFGIGFLIGYIICGILINVLDASTATVIVLFAEYPSDLKLYHPSLFDELKASYIRAYPDECKQNHGD